MTLIIVIITSLISIAAFRSDELMSRLLLNPYKVYHNQEWYRIITHGFVHADWYHLIINMIVLYSFGIAVENYFSQLESAGYIAHPRISYLVLYFVAIVISSVTTLWKHRDNSLYNSVGASGAVSAVVFTSIFFGPMNRLLFYFIPLPGILGGVIYLVYSHYMSRRGKDNINHDAHFIGAVFGFIFPLFLDIHLIQIFFQQLGLG